MCGGLRTGERRNTRCFGILYSINYPRHWYSIIILGSTFLIRRRKIDVESETWSNEEIVPTRDERIPEGWTLEEFLNWLDGPMPEDWQEDQWNYKLSLDDLR